MLERQTETNTLTLAHEQTTQLGMPKVCMYVLGTARTDVRVLREATALKDAGFAVWIVDIEGDSQRPAEEDVHGLHLKHIVMPSWFTPVRFKMLFPLKMLRLALQGTVKLLQTPADMYHAHDDTALPACFLAACLRHKPLVFDAHELPLTEPNITRWRVLCALARWSLIQMMARCAGVITVSPPIVEELRQRYGGPRAILVRNIPKAQTPVPSDQLRQYLGLSADTRIALYQGNLDSRGLEKLIPAAKFIADSTVIVMMGKGAIQPELERLIAQEQVGERIKIIPPVPYAELLNWTASADIGLVVYAPSSAATLTPNVQFCLPNKLFEYLMAGLPVLASSLDAVAEIVQTYAVGAVMTSLGPKAVGEAINALLADKEALARMRANVQVAIQQDLNWECESRHLIDFYADIVAT